MKSLKVITLIFSCLLSQAIFAAPVAKFTFRVIDQNAQPVEGAEVGVYFRGGMEDSAKGFTDADGLFEASGSVWSLVSYFSTKDGYYKLQGQYTDFKEMSGVYGFRRWQPWNQTIEIVLKEKIRPIALYAINIRELEIPVLDEFVGFDLIRSDWVVPHGRGLNKDFLFKFIKRRAVSGSDYDIELVVAFSHPEDGIQPVSAPPELVGSKLRLPHRAPLSGYQNQLVISKNRVAGKIYYYSSEVEPDEYKNYFYRIRTETDGDGNIVSAIYGKIHGVFNVDFVREPTGKLFFNYYLNPTPNDTNLEFDNKKNLFTNLTGRQRVGLP